MKKQSIKGVSERKKEKNFFYQPENRRMVERRIKNQQKECVAWSSYISLEFEKEACKDAYTLIRRTAVALIIVSKEQTQEGHKKLLGPLNHQRIISWDKN